MHSVKYNVKVIDEDTTAWWFTVGNVTYLRFIHRSEIEGGNEE